MPSPDDGYREIQLNGKQLIFLFMATTIVAVVIFLCGVTVGRGVRNASTVAGAEPAASASPAVDIGAVPTDTRPTDKPMQAPPPAAAAPVPPPEPAGPVAAENGAPSKDAAARPPSAAAEKPAPSRTPAAAASAPAVPPVSKTAGPTSEPAGEGFAVQVVALSDRSQAEARAKDLIAKGYPAYVVAPPAAGGMFRVRIGKFPDRRQADAVKSRLVKEEKINPFVVPTR
jgi:cell division septation protein DedD